MKRYLLILLLIAAIGILAAVESAPSATVGYFKKHVASDTWEILSLPFNYSANDSVNVILGTQFAQDDVIQDVYTGTSTTYFDGFGWFGDLTSLTPGSAYWVYRAATNTDMDYYIMGTVNPVSTTVHVYADGWSCFSLNDCAPVLIETLSIPGAIQDDVIQDVYTGTSTTFFDGFGWFGDLVQIDPTHAYWYYTTSTSDFEWTYTPARGTSNPAVVVPTTGSARKTPSIRTKK
jgi:hypothetical protein